jgi:hypothetical protein
MDRDKRITSPQNIAEEDENNMKYKYKNSMFTFSNESKKSEFPSCNTCLNKQSINNDQFSNYSIDLRLNNMERRLDNTEKMLRFYEELLRLKQEEKENEYKIDQNKLSEINQKVGSLEEMIKILSKKINDQNEVIDSKIGVYDKKLSRFTDTKNTIGDFYASKLSELEALIKKNDILFENVLDERIATMSSNIDSKLEEFLNILNEVGKTTEQNEFTIVESKENIRMLQNDHLDFIKIVSILKEKSDSLDYIMSQVTDLKLKYGKIVNIYGEHSQEEDKFLNKILGGERGNTNETYERLKKY